MEDYVLTGIMWLTLGLCALELCLIVYDLWKDRHDRP